MNSISNPEQTPSSLSAIQSLTEQELTERLVVPLLRAMSYVRVECHGGPCEHGADVLAVKSNELGEEELLAVQLKKLQASAVASGTTSASGTMNQLWQAVGSEFAMPDGSRRKPSKVWFVTPYPISTRALDSLIPNDPYVKTNRISLIDGERLLTLLIKYIPDTLDDVLGPQSPTTAIDVIDLQHTELIQALATQSQGRPLPAIYMDIDLVVGKPSTRLLFYDRLLPTHYTADLLPADIDDTIQSLSRISTATGVRPCIHSDNDLRRMRKRAMSTIKRREDAIAAIRNQLDECVKQAQDVHSAANRPKRQTALEYSVARYAETVLANLRDPEWPNIIDDDGFFFRTDVVTLGRLKQADINKESERIYLDFDDLRKSVLSLKNKIQKGQRGNSESVTCPVTFDGTSLAEVIVAARRRLAEKIRGLGDNASTTDLRSFLLESRDLYERFNEALEWPEITASLGIRTRHDVVQHPDIYRTKVSAHSVLDTGLNILLLGDAGSGKTTSLKMYATRGIANNNLIAKKKLFVPLARVASLWLKKPKQGDASSATPALEDALALYFLDRKPNKHSWVSSITKMLSSGSIVLLLDALDEAIRWLPWLPASIQQASIKYPGCQIIVSSRPYIKSLDTMTFPSVTLLAFTPEQLTSFVRKWFDGDESTSLDVLRHLSQNPEMASVTRSPLLATVLCALAEAEVPLPRSEIRLYSERMRLLLGEFDLTKRVVRLRTDRELLHNIARLIAFRLHEAGRREASVDEIRFACESFVDSHGTREQVYTAIEDLAECYVLLPGVEEGKLGFGHLRYQEYLCAEYMAIGGVDVISFFDRNWWRDALLMWSKMLASFDVFLRKVVTDTRVSDRSLELIAKMVQQRSRAEQESLRRLLRGMPYSKSQRLELLLDPPLPPTTSP